MKTILLTVFQGIEAKNLLRTNVLSSLLADKEVRVVCLMRYPERAEYYRREIPRERVIFDSCGAASSGFFERIMRALKFSLLRTETTDLKRRMRFEETGRRGVYLAGLLLNRLAARRSVRQLLRFLDYRLVSDPGFGAVLERHRPDVVLLAHLFDDAEIAVLREARRRGIPTVGFINSWDKLTARSAIRLLPDRLLVYNGIVREEAMRHADMPSSCIAIVGIPQYDQYVGHRPAARAEFLAKTKLAPERKIVLFAPMGRAFSRSDWEMADFLHRSVHQEGRVPGAELLVRFQPNDFVDQAQLARRPHLRYDLPGLRYGSERSGDWDMTASELTHLADTLAYADLLVCHASSLSVDAAVFDVPVININFEIQPLSRPTRSPVRFYAMEHYRKAIASGGIRCVSSPEELVEWMRRYLADRGLDRGGRARLVREQCGVLDGRAGERIAAEVLRALAR